MTPLLFVLVLDLEVSLCSMSFFLLILHYILCFRPNLI